MTPHRPKNKMSTDKTKAHVIRLLPTAVLWAWLHAGESHGAPSCCSASFSSLTQTWLNILDQPGPVNNTQVWVVFLIQRIEASGKQTPGWFKFEDISNGNLLKIAVSNILKSIRQKKWISAAFLCPVLSLRYVLLLLKQNSPTLSYAILMTQPQERHRQTTSDVQQIKNYSYTHKKKKVKEATTEQMGINTEAYILTWLEAVQPLHEHTTSTDWAFHFLLHVPLIREAVLYFLQCDFDLILVPKWLKRD